MAGWRTDRRGSPKDGTRKRPDRAAADAADKGATERPRGLCERPLDRPRRLRLGGAR